MVTLLLLTFYVSFVFYSATMYKTVREMKVTNKLLNILEIILHHAGRNNRDETESSCDVSHKSKCTRLAKKGMGR